MERRFVIPAALAALVAAAPARAQLRTAAVRVPAWSQTQLGVGPVGGSATADDLLLFGPSNLAAPSASYLPDGDLWTRGRPVPYATPAVPGFEAAVGLFNDGTTATAPPDVVWEVRTGGTGLGNGFLVSWGSAPATPETIPGVIDYASHGLSPLRLLPRPEPLLVATDIMGAAGYQETAAIFDLRGSKGTGAAAAPPTKLTFVPFFSPQDDEPARDRVYAVRASPAALSLGVSDAIIPMVRGFRVLWNRTAAGATTLAGLALDYVDVGDIPVSVSYPLQPFPTTYLEPGLTLLPGTTCFGVGALDVDGDGRPDLVFTMRESPGKLLWLHNTTTSPGLTTAIWHSMMARGDVYPNPSPGRIPDPRVLRQVELASGPAIAVHDAGLDEILVISGTGTAGFAVQRLPAFGGLVKELWAADVTGNGAPDLLAWVTAPGGRQEVWVYPDELDTRSWLAWSPIPPATAPLGTDLPLSVAATSPGATVTVIDTTVIDGAAVQRPAATSGTAFTIPGSDLCGGPAPVRILARASVLRPVDDLGMLEQVEASVSLAAVPTLRVAGAAAPDLLVLAPGGTRARSEGAAWPGCQTTTPPSYAWGQVALPGLATLAEQAAGSTTAWREFTVPESAYPTLLSGAPTPALTLTAIGPTKSSTGDVTGAASLPLRLDARALVATTVAFDAAALAPGEVAVARITLASRIGVALPLVRAEVKLAGLVLAGEPHLKGARAEEGAAATLVLDSLPASPATVGIEVPVRALGAPGEVSVELYSEGGYRLSPEVAPSAEATRLPGCGCGGGGAEGLPIAIAALALAWIGRRGRDRAPTT
ncbi:MAG TPA: hypothetical protein VLT47_09325 [Anaeromyxobacteraceae bacterium]|nr:hypothetical protein [Anaeromyxobacteraceae bacterium]